TLQRALTLLSCSPCSGHHAAVHNLSLERTSTGKALGPRTAQAYHASRGPSALPAAAAQLKRYPPWLAAPARSRNQVMPKRAVVSNYSAENKAVLDGLLLELPDVRPGKMFGFPAYYAGKKLCICLYEKGVGLKLPAESVTKLLESDRNVISFQPMGKTKMREWVQINLSRSEDYRRYKALFDESIHYLLDQQGEGRS
ncbi:MAG: hypothetical protein ACK511_08905, partial [Burkholderiales bacterium]